MPESQGQPEKQQKPKQPRERKERKQRAAPGEQARRLVRNARQAANDGEPTPKAEFLMSEANVMATLDLADAIREQQKQ